MKIISTLLLLLCLSPAFAQDSTAYNLQRAKINGMLDDRSARFGEYDQSLLTRTGFFGNQTKRDIKNSNEILRQVVLADNRIFLELKALLDYKDLQVQEVKTNVSHSDESLLAYRNTIKNLQQKNKELSDQVNEKETGSGVLYVVIILLVIAIGLLFNRLYQTNKRLNHEKTTL